MEELKNPNHSIIPEIETDVLQIARQINSLNYKLTFSGQEKNCCVGIVDMVNSTKITFLLNNDQLAMYYSIFLNSMAMIAKKYGAVIVKNVGDSLLYYFPESEKSFTKYGIISCLECCVAMLEARDAINEQLLKQGLPYLNYRISADYGNVMIAQSSNSSCKDLFGSSVNMCAKINCKADENEIVIGGDLYQKVSKLDDYHFKEIKGYACGLKNQYPIYLLTRTNQL